MIRIISFGYGHAPAPTAEATYDLRKLFDNPFDDPELKHLTGLDAPVYDHVLKTRGVEELAVWVANGAIGLNRSTGVDVVLAYGCIGGRHRSVALARLTREHLQLAGRTVSVQHRDITKPLLPPGVHRR
ncbi:hypothetical protein ACFQ7N_40515 [Streptomyces niveus]|uniref:RapZ C-terminal domain-containing protein n=1 Tax=Streptomyces niveus TaxID=193462 RepID=UPI0036BA3B11